VIDKAAEQIEENFDPDTVRESPELLRKKIRSYTLIIFAIAISTGILQIALYPNLFYVKRELNREPHEYARFRSISAIAWSIKPVLAYFEDSINPFYSRVKYWMVLGCLMNIGGSILIVLLKPDYWPFTFCYMLCNFANVIHDVLAQGMSVILLNLYRQLAEAEARYERHLGTTEVLLEGEKGATEGKKVYANYHLTRFILRTVATFIGGAIATTFPIRVVFIIIAAVQGAVLIYALFFFWEQKSKTIFSGHRNLFTDIGKFYRAIIGRDTLFPLIIMILLRVCPDCSDAGTYILNDIMEWTSFDLSLMTLVAGIIYYVLMITLINKAKDLGVKTQVGIAGVCACLYNYSNFRFLYYNELTYWSMFGFSLLSTMLQNVSGDLILFAIVGRFSMKCPKGLEGFGVTAIAAVSNFGASSAGLLGAQLLDEYHVHHLDYTNLLKPFMVSFGFSAATMLVTPIFGR
jgi:hypothetical protein